MRKVVAGMLAMGVFVTVGVAQNPNLTRSAVGVKQDASVSAGEPKMKHRTPDEWVKELDEVVGLSADQKVRAKSMAEQRETQMKAAREEMKSSGDKEAIQKKHMQMRKDQRAALESLLTPEQNAKWNAHREAMKPAVGGHKHRTADEQVSDLDAVVTLTADQKTKVKALVEAKEIKMKALREEQKKTPDENVFKEKRQQIGKEYRTELEKVLTTEQKAKLKAHREAMKSKKGTLTK